MKLATIMLLVIGAGLCVLTASGRALSQTPVPTCEPFPGQVEVKVIPGADIYALATTHGDTVRGMLFPGSTDEVLSRWWSIKVLEGSEKNKALEYAADPAVEAAEPNCIIFVNDPTPLATPSPTPTPAALPKTGGPPTP